MRPTADLPNEATDEPGVFWQLFGIDIRALAFLRIGLGVVVLLDLIVRANSITAHYTDAGTLPRDLRTQMGIGETYVAPPWQLSLHMISGSFWWQVILFAVAATAAIALLVGYRTRLATIATWFLLISLHARNPAVVNGGDDLLRCGLFWAMLLPLGAIWSWDAKHNPEDSDVRLNRQRVANFATAGLVLQLYSMYWFTALLKWGPTWRVDMSAVYYALSYDHFTTRFGYYLLEWPQVLWVLTLGTILLEFFGPFLLLCPIGSRKLRIAIPLAFIGLHFGLATAMRLGLFPIICAMFWCLLFPSEIWDTISVRFKKRSDLLRLYTPARDTSDADAKPRWACYAAQTLAAYCILFVIWQNAVRLDGGMHVDVPNGLVRWVGRSAQLNQFWPMFSPDAPTAGGWLVIKGTLRDGCEVNLLDPRRGLEDRRPDLISSTYPNQRWRKHLMSLFEGESPCSRVGTCDYLSRRWNETHSESRQVVSAEILLVRDVTNPPMSTEPDPPSTVVSIFSKDYSSPDHQVAGANGPSSF